MDPLDKEKPWGALGRLAVIALPIGFVYLVIRLAAVVADEAWQLLLSVTAVGAVLYYFLAFRTRKRRLASPLTTRHIAVQAVTLVLIAVVLTLPGWVAFYYLRNGALPWD
jgi:hypothetical protein